MHARPSTLVTATAAIMSAVLVLSACEARVYGTPPAETDTPQLTIVAPQGNMAPLPDAPPDRPAAAFDGLDARAKQATAEAAKSGAHITVVVLDRNTDQIVSNGDNQAFPTASVVKLFIADDLLLQESKGQTTLSPADRKSLDVMLRSSDDGAAQNFWNRSGGNAVISRVVARYGLTGTTAPYNGHWDVTLTTARDLVRYYDMLLDGTGGCRPNRPTSSWAISRSRRRPVSTATRNASAFPRGFMPSRSPSSRAGFAAGTAPTSCTCPPA